VSHRQAAPRGRQGVDLSGELPEGRPRSRRLGLHRGGSMGEGIEESRDPGLCAAAATRERRHFPPDPTPGRAESLTVNVWPTGALGQRGVDKQRLGTPRIGGDLGARRSDSSPVGRATSRPGRSANNPAIARRPVSRRPNRRTAERKRRRPPDRPHSAADLQGREWRQRRPPFYRTVSRWSRAQRTLLAGTIPVDLRLLAGAPLLRGTGRREGIRGKAIYGVCVPPLTSLLRRCFT
jgi:hypothetical protein